MLHASHQTTNYPKNRKSVLTQTHIKKNTHQTQYFWRTIIIIHPLNTRVVGAPQMISQPVSSIFPCSPLPSEDLANSRPVHSLMLSSHLFLCLPCLFPPFTVPCKMVLARPDARETWPYHCSLHLFTNVICFKLSLGCAYVGSLTVFIHVI